MAFGGLEKLYVSPTLRAQGPTARLYKDGGVKTVVTGRDIVLPAELARGIEEKAAEKGPYMAMAEIPKDNFLAIINILLLFCVIFGAFCHWRSGIEEGKGVQRGCGRQRTRN
ncbi:hypothetical protein OSB04_020115 [Centaurea solstitialis]|uniref:Uncharacterized protein n=1 Tax=Centaurea solstitialis TaxID=347529 RepID=A0AA38TA19_9ASTR|nr:hypothetical protein OSB04_020115 [Centaurea solstitialis]